MSDYLTISDYGAEKELSNADAMRRNECPVAWILGIALLESSISGIHFYSSLQ
jgi:hypothetical protein